MSSTPLSMRRHVIIFGKTNSGKSSLFNAILNQQAAIVSEQSGTTTDPVVKAMELIPFGAIALVDTAGMGDISDIGSLRMKKSFDMLNRADLVIYAADPGDFTDEEYKNTTELFKSRNIKHLLCFTKSDLYDDEMKNLYINRYPDCVFVNSENEQSIIDLKSAMCEALSDLSEQPPVLSRLLQSGAHIVMCIPCDSAAPKGRLILPQVQLIRECLDLGMTCSCATPDELPQLIDNCKQIDLVVTDSQAFAAVSEIVPQDIQLTSFSMLLAAQKGDIAAMMEGARQIDNLKDGDRILIAEACTHNKTHEDIGTVKIPALLRKYTGKQLEFDFNQGHDFEDELSRYALVVHCGGCMITEKEIRSRMQLCAEQGVYITNYGVALAFLNGIADRCFKIFED